MWKCNEERANWNKLFPRHQLAQDKRQNPAVPVVIDLDRRIDSQLYRNLFVLSIFVRDLERDHLSGLDRLRQSGDRVNFRAAESQRLCVRALGKLQRQHAHADKI